MDTVRQTLSNFLKLRNSAVARTSATHLFLIFLIVGILKPVCMAVFLADAGSRVLALAWILSAAGAFVYASIYRRSLIRFSPGQIYRFLLLAFFLWFIGLSFALQTRLPLPALLLFVSVDLFEISLIEKVWNYTNTGFSKENAKETYGALGATAILGGIAGQAIAAMLVPVLGTFSLIYCASGLVLFQVVLSWTVPLDHKLQKARAKPLVERAESSEGETSWSHLLSQPKLVFIGLIIVGLYSGSTLIDYLFNRTIESFGWSLDTKASFFSVFFLGLNVCSFTLLAFFANKLHHKLKQSLLLGILPITNLGLIGAFLLSLYSPLILLLRFADRLLMLSIIRTALEQVYVEIPENLATAAKPLTSVFASRLGKVLSAIMILAYFSHRSQIILAEACSLIMLGLLVLFFAYDRYTAKTRQKPAPRMPLPAGRVSE